MTGRLLGMAAAAAVACLLMTACGSSDDDDSASDDAPTTTPADTAAEDSTEDPPETVDDAPTDGDGESPAEEDDAEAVDEPEPEPADLGDLEVVAVVFDTNMVQIQNVGTEPVSMEGLWICNRPGYERLPPITLEPSGGIQIELPGGVSEAGGEAAIYSSDSFGSADAVVSYVHWGGGGGRASVAEEAGEWSGPPVDVLPEGLFLSGEPGSAAGWG